MTSRSFYKTSCSFSNFLVLLTNTYCSMSLRSLILLWCVTTATAAPAPGNSTVVLPAGAFYRGDGDLLCKPAKVTDTLIFLVANYLAHAATTRTWAGESIIDSVLAAVGALLLPGSGVFRGLRAIASNARFAKNDLTTAARAGALCTLVKRSYMSEKGISIQGMIGRAKRLW